jgi:hypothetical protein
VSARFSVKYKLMPGSNVRMWVSYLCF